MANWLTRLLGARDVDAAGDPLVEQRSGIVTDTFGTISGWRGPSVFGPSGAWDPIGEGVQHVRSSALAARCLAIQTGMLAARLLDVVDSDDATLPGAQVFRDRFNYDWGNGVAAHSNRAMLWGRMERYGQAHILMNRGPSRVGEVRSMTLLMGRVEALVSSPTLDHPDGELTGWRYWDANGRALTADLGEVLWLRYPDPEARWGVVSPLSGALTDIALQYAARVWQAAQMRGGSAQALIDLPGAPAEVIAAVRQEVDALASGASNAGRVVVGASAKDSPGMRVHNLSLTAQDLAWMDGMGLTNEQILHAFNVPRDLVLGGSTFENQRTAARSLWTLNLLPKLRMVASEIDRVFYPTSAASATFPTSDVPELQDDQDARTRRLQQAAYADLMTMDELRAAQGLEPIENGHLTRTAYNALSLALVAAEFAPQTTDQGAGEAARVTATQVVRGTIEAPDTRAESTVGGASTAKAIEKNTKTSKRTMERLAKQQADRVIALLGRKGKRGRAIRNEDESAEDVVEQIWFEGEQAAFAAAALTEAVESVYFESSTGMAAALRRLGVNVDGAFETGDVPQTVLDALDRLATETAEQINATTKDALTAALREGLAEGEDIPALSGRVRDVFAWGGDEGRATLIARDVVLAAYHEGQHVTIEGSSLANSKVTKRWQAAGDNRVRPSHQALDGATVAGLNGRFSNGALYPGDRAAGTAESIQCRCVLEYDFDVEDEA